MLLCLVVSSPVSGAGPDAPGDHPAEVDGEELPSPAGSPPPDRLTWDAANGCSGKSQPGTQDLLRYLEHWWPRGESWGIYSCRLPSLHSEGRAIDYHLDVRNSRDRRAGYAISRFFRAKDANGIKWAMARRFGIQEVIFNCKVWGAERRHEGWRPYYRCGEAGANRTAKHKDHIHIGQSWRGATRRTSAWTGF